MTSEDSRRGFAHFISSETALFKASTSDEICDGALRLHEVHGFAKYHKLLRHAWECTFIDCR